MKIHPLLRLAASEPHLLGDHVKAYFTLIKDEAGKASISLAMRVGLYAAAAVLLLLALILIGVALLLRASVPSDDYPAGWALVVVPLAPVVIAVILVFIARSKPVENGFDTVRKQLDADVAMLREASAP